MRESQTAITRGLNRFIVLILLLVSVGRLRAMVDLNANSMSDVWEKIRGATNVNANVDSDGDGFPNLLESIAGTDPFNANSFPKMGGIALAGTNVVMNVPSAPGKLYQLQSCP